MRIPFVVLLSISAILCLSACAETQRIPGGEPAKPSGARKFTFRTDLPIVVASAQFILETDIGSEFAPKEIARKNTPEDAAREMARMLLDRLDTYFRTLYGPGFGLASDKMKRGMVYEQGENRNVVPSKQEIQSVRPQPVRRLRVALFVSEKDYRAYVQKAGLLEYYADAALNPEKSVLATYLHDTEEGTLDALFRLVCHGFMAQMSPLYPAWLEFGIAAYLTQLDRRRGIYGIVGKDPARLQQIQKFFGEGGKLNLRNLLSEEAKRTGFPDDKKLISYGFVYWMMSGESKRRAIYSYVHELKQNEVVKEALIEWQKIPEETRNKIKRPRPEADSAIRDRFFGRLHNDFEEAEEYCRRFLLSKRFSSESTAPEKSRRSP
ncbi:MAG: hypothetical protein ACYS8W_06725 [Planctomycetota bacterium]|jgi:hypothetical protein